MSIKFSSIQLLCNNVMKEGLKLDSSTLPVTWSPGNWVSLTVEKSVKSKSKGKIMMWNTAKVKNAEHFFTVVFYVNVLSFTGQHVLLQSPKPGVSNSGSGATVLQASQLSQQPQSAPPTIAPKPSPVQSKPSGSSSQNQNSVYSQNVFVDGKNMIIIFYPIHHNRFVNCS